MTPTFTRTRCMDLVMRSHQGRLRLVPLVKAEAEIRTTGGTWVER